jgi:hypothetical protein
VGVEEEEVIYLISFNSLFSIWPARSNYPISSNVWDEMGWDGTK